MAFIEEGEVAYTMINGKKVPVVKCETEVVLRNKETNYEYNSVSAIIGFPYNPYHPKEYNRFSTQIFDKNNDILVQESLWNSIAGFDVYNDLIKTVQKVGKQNQKKISSKIKKISKN